MVQSRPKSTDDNSELKPPTRAAILSLGLLAVMAGITVAFGLVLGDVIQYEGHQGRLNQHGTLRVAYLKDVSEELFPPKLAITGSVKYVQPSKASMTAPSKQKLSKEINNAPQIAAFQLNRPLTWQTTTLDNGVRLEMLKEPIKLSETEQNTGLEQFFYTAYLYRQMAEQVKNPELSKSLIQLSYQADAMGNTLQRAIRIRFEGRPNEDMIHLKVRSGIMLELSQLTKAPLRLVDFNRHGVILSQSPSPAGNPGPLTQRFEASYQALESPKYAKTVALAKKQGQQLSALARQLELRWDSVFECNETTLSGCLKAYNQDEPAQGPKRMRIYVRQNAGKS